MRRTSSNNSFSAQRLMLLAPSSSSAPASLRRVHASSDEHATLLADVQRLRGRVYLADGAITAAQLDEEGRLRMPHDEDSWHLLVLNNQGAVAGCARYLAHPNEGISNRMSVMRSALARCEQWGSRLQFAVESELARAQRRSIPFVELGGWALDEELRGTREAVRIALTTYALARALGGGVGTCTATVRHCSAAILRKIGGKPLAADGVELPRYFDPHYDCEMEIIRFDSAEPNPKYDGLVEELSAQLRAVPTVCPTARHESAAAESTVGGMVRPGFFTGLQLATC